MQLQLIAFLVMLPDSDDVQRGVVRTVVSVTAN